MRLFVVCDNDDTATGLRLAGIDGVRVKDAEDARAQILKIAENHEIGILLVNRNLMVEITDFVHEFRKTHNLPLITEIPDNSGRKSTNSIARYVREAVGIRE